MQNLRTCYVRDLSLQINSNRTANLESLLLLCNQQPSSKDSAGRTEDFQDCVGKISSVTCFCLLMAVLPVYIATLRPVFSFIFGEFTAVEEE